MPLCGVCGTLIIRLVIFDWVVILIRVVTIMYCNGLPTAGTHRCGSVYWGERRAANQGGQREGKMSRPLLIFVGWLLVQPQLPVHIFISSPVVSLSFVCYCSIADQLFF